jgi:hypothetical protein
LARQAAGALLNPTPSTQPAKPDQPAANATQAPTPAYRPAEQKKLNQLFDNQSR